MSTDHNRIKVADLEKNQPNKTLITNENGELEFSDITGGAQDLQSVLINGNIASGTGASGGASTLLMNPDAQNSYSNNFFIYRGLTDSSIYQDPLQIYIDNRNNIGGSRIRTSTTGIEISQELTDIGKTTVKISDPIANTTINFPAKPEGTYTLATIEDVGGSQDDITMQKLIETSTDVDNRTAYYDSGSTRDGQRAIGFKGSTEDGTELSSELGIDHIYMISTSGTTTDYLTTNYGAYALGRSINGGANWNTALRYNGIYFQDNDATQNLSILFPKLRAGGPLAIKTMPLSVNGEFADDNGNITLSGGSSLNFQSVVNNGSYAELTNITSESTSVIAMDSNDSFSRSYIFSETTLSGQESGGEIRTENGQIFLTQQNIATGSVSTLAFAPPMALSIDGDAIINVPAKPSGTYTLATLDDITSGGGSQNLQSVLDNGKDASIDGGNSTIGFFGDGSTENERYIDMSIGNGTDATSMGLSNTSVTMYGGNNTDGRTGYFQVNSGKVLVVEQDNVSGGASSFNLPLNPTNFVDFVLPIINEDGEKTIAIRNDITLQNTLDNNNIAYDTYFDLVNTNSDRTTRFNTSGMDIYTGSLYPEYVYDEDIRHYDGVSGTLQSTFNFRGLGNFSLPNKTIGDNYTLASLDDIPLVKNSTNTNVSWNSIVAASSLIKVGRTGNNHEVSLKANNNNLSLNNSGLDIKAAANSNSGSIRLFGTINSFYSLSFELPTDKPAGNYKIATIDDISNLRPYKVYTALISQSDENAPTVIVLENTLGYTVEWERIYTGNYSATIAGGFTEDKTVIFTNNRNSESMWYCVAERGSNGAVYVRTLIDGGAGSAIEMDGLLVKSTIEIRVYN